ncbi:hypothetical protein M422DRAFT_33779 [Sphaerobolus stellatus SS14]|uniref:Enoyl-CoA hydratase n=1 Tax=Sphaerobolus stellatus (strain SS14) TaxID=990650 RepID=A0A0C9U3P3_SPHS4|nr:hypothetical protein M422DRAFT_33779 [Sphaerobolus stellatus SS14]
MATTLTFARHASRTHFPSVFRRLYASAPAKEAFLEMSTHNTGVAWIALNRPKAKNAISMRLLQEFRECLDEVKGDKKVRTLIIRSQEPGSFCAGADLAERAIMSKSQVETFLLDLRAALSTLENLSVPTIAAIDGPALGGGLEMALACDLRVAAHGVTRIGLPEVRLGIIPGAGGTQRATRLLGLSKARKLIFTGKSLTAEESLEWGLVDYISEKDQTAFSKALNVANEFSGAAPLALRAAKLAISRAPELALEPGLDFENACYQPLLTSTDRDEALLAFKEKRPPQFKGE